LSAVKELNVLRFPRRLATGKFGYSMVYATSRIVQANNSKYSLLGDIIIIKLDIINVDLTIL